jgi:glutamate 5-kinase
VTARPTVVKLGSSLIAAGDGEPRHDLIAAIADATAARVLQGEPVAIVSSGAIALGRRKAGWPTKRRPKLGQLQAASALGQAELQQLWQRAFEPHALQVAQVLLTARDVTERRSYLNVRETLLRLLVAGAVPVINENDATATDEITFGDNDVLAAQTAVLLRARRLVLLTNVDGIMSAPPGGDGLIVKDGATVDESMFGAGSPLGRGGVASKVAAARLAAAGGVETFISSPGGLPELLAGGEAGTRFEAHAQGESAFKLWLRYGARVVSDVTVDDGAAAALRGGGASLLAVGVVEWTNDFRIGDGIAISTRDGGQVARGIAAVDAASVRARAHGTEVVHRDRLVLVDAT